MPEAFSRGITSHLRGPLCQPAPSPAHGEDSGPSPPLVTFAVFAYNQEQYILDAIGSAFAQTYVPLEIILSDDCSSDRTYEIMLRCASTYRGPHQLTVRRSVKNISLWHHLADVSAAARGEYLVVAAGDDISSKDRCARLIPLMISENASAAASNYNRMDASGKIVSFDVVSDYSRNYLRELVSVDCSAFINGATAAYRITFLRNAIHATPAAIQGKVYNEDILLSAYAIAAQEKVIQYTDAPLVNYRISATSLSNFSPGAHSYTEEQKLLKRERMRSQARHSLLSSIEDLAREYPSFSVKVNWARLRSDKRMNMLEMKSSAPELLTRVQAIWQIRRTKDVRIIFPRLFGCRFLSAIRFIRKLLFANV